MGCRSAQLRLADFGLRNEELSGRLADRKSEADSSQRPAFIGFGCDPRSARCYAGGDGAARHLPAPYTHTPPASGLCYPKTNFRTRSKKCLDGPKYFCYRSPHDAGIIISRRARPLSRRGATIRMREGGGIWRRQVNGKIFTYLRLFSLILAYLRLMGKKCLRALRGPRADRGGARLRQQTIIPPATDCT